MRFSAKVLLQAFYFRKNKIVKKVRPLYEEIIMLIKARNEVNAKQLLRNYVKKNKTVYRNQRNERLEWRVIKIFDIQEINERLGTCAEISYRHFRNISAYKRFDHMAG